MTPYDIKASHLILNYAHCLLIHIEKQEFELERQKWSKSLAEKNSTVQQLERELSSTVDALHLAMQAKATHDFDNASSSSSSITTSHSPHHKSGHHHNGHIYYDEDGRKRDDRIGIYIPDYSVYQLLAFFLLPINLFRI